MRLATRSGLIATTLTIAAIAAPGAQAGGLFSGPGPDPRGADQQEAQAFLRLAAANSLPVSAPTATSTTQGSSFDYGDAAVGAGIAGGIALLITAGSLTVRRRGELHHS